MKNGIIKSVENLGCDDSAGWCDFDGTERLGKVVEIRSECSEFQYLYRHYIERETTWSTELEQNQMRDRTVKNHKNFGTHLAKQKTKIGMVKAINGRA